MGVGESCCFVYEGVPIFVCLSPKILCHIQRFMVADFCRDDLSYTVVATVKTDHVFREPTATQYTTHHP